MSAAVCGWTAGAVWIFVSAVWWRSRRQQDASLVDIAWGPGVWLAGALPALLAGGGWTPRTALALGLGALWAARLATHVARRHRRTGEDPRYRAWREAGGPGWFARAYGSVFLLQGALMLPVAFPLAATGMADAPAGWSLLDGAGLLLFAAGLWIETAADRGLEAFRSDPANRGRVLDRGLWGWSRHPNYFGEALLWWGLGLVGLAAGAVWSLAGPALLTGLLLAFSGVPLLEKRLLETRPAYAAYVRRTSAFLPWPPKRD